VRGHSSCGRFWSTPPAKRLLARSGASYTCCSARQFYRTVCGGPVPS